MEKKNQFLKCWLSLMWMIIGDTFIMYHQQTKGKNKRELIQLGAPIFGPVKKEATSQCQKSKFYNLCHKS